MVDSISDNIDETQRAVHMCHTREGFLMAAYGYIRGHRWRQTEFGKCLTTIGLKPGEELKCTRCGKPPTPEGHDACLGRLPGVQAACCGHGVEEGYIQFQNGVIIRGFFRVEHNEEGGIL